MADTIQKTGKNKDGQFFAEIIENIKLSDDTYRIALYSEKISNNAKPGQFVSVLCGNLTLRRPFSIASVNNETFSIIYKVKGQGTDYISKLSIGANVDLIGPIGKGFNIENKKSLLIGAGVGIAPMIFLSQILKDKGIFHYILAGFRNYIDIKELNNENASLITEDGASGNRGFINDYVEELIIRNKIEKIYTCGPVPVMKFAVDMAIKYNLDIETALEKEFACGIGVCMGCSIDYREDDIVVNKRICKDGPVFNGRNVVW